MEFHGYKRDDGKYGVRNHVLVVSSVSCANGVVDAIGRVFPDVITIQHTYGCGYGPDDFMTSMKVLQGIINNPNVGAVLAVGLGCELLKAEYLAQAAQGKPAESLVIQQAGSAATTKKGIDITEKFIKHLAPQKRVPAPVSELLVGLKCGGSDAFSGVTANPSLGAAADLLVGEGATVVMGEVTEMIGTSHILKKRCADTELGAKLEKLILDHEQHVRTSLGELAGLVIAPGNMDGGLSSITEKSLGCNAKSGTTTINELVEYGSGPTKKGLIIMNAPGYDIDCMAGMASGGAQIIVFTTGRGTPAGFPAVPVIKVSSNSKIYNSMVGDIDINAGSILEKGRTINDIGREIYELCLKVAEGELTRAEVNRSTPFSCLKTGPTF